ncbi:MAG: PQQ-binding-like beta-propeller repeat protein [Rubinisphaera brasiliensis]|uniref:PQQ-binding-like beta-propeller repeat protein n=1 Tax=Rubinisphaera brasiliensis TaxID=119 RepID=UPI00391D8F63
MAAISREFRVSAFCCLLALSASLSCINGVHAGDWPEWRGPDRDGICKETGLKLDWKEAPALEFMTEGFGRGYAGVAVVDGVLYTTGNQEEGQAVVAADAATGKILWKTLMTEHSPEHRYPGSRCTPSVDNGMVYAIASDGKICCLDAKSGSLKWSKSFQDEWNGQMMSGWGFSESPLIDGDRVLCTPGGPEATIVCLNKKTGKEIWRSAVPQLGEEGKDGAGYSSIVISNGAGVKQYVQLVGRGVVGVRASDGKFLWGYNQVANETANIPTPIVDGDYVFASSSYNGGGSVYLKLTKSGDGVEANEEYWMEKRDFNNHHGGLVLVDGYIYGGHNQNQGFPTCVNEKTGEIVWGGNGQRGEGKGSAAVLYADNRLIFRYQDGLVVSLNASPEGYEVAGQFMPAYQEDKSWAHPVIVDGKMYLREQDKLMCYSVK